MFRFFAGAGLVSAAILAATSANAQTAFDASPLRQLMPMPGDVQAGSGEFVLASPLTVAVSPGASPRLLRSLDRTIHRLEGKTGFALGATVTTGSSGALLVQVQSDSAPVQTLEEDESYTLTVTSNSVHIEAPNTLGAMHAFETLIQLTIPQNGHYVVPAVTVHDTPRFRWRGLMIDCGRHFEPMSVLKRNIDAMAAVKLNVFHWHLTEDQGFRIESKLFPNLTAAGSDGLFYTQQDARDLVAYAHERGIRVVPEFEMPGHSTAWLVAYPELISGSKPAGIRREFGVSDFAIDPTREETYRFIAKFLGEMINIFPDAYVHIGGDETPAPDWKTNPRILAFMKNHKLHSNEELQAYFNQRVVAILTKLNRHMVGWDEILNPALPKNVVVQSWRGEAALADGARQGYQGVLSAPYYLDGMKPAGVHYVADPLPASTTLTPDQQKLVLGGEICMWGEHIAEHTIDSRIWPRSAAIAERFWSPASINNIDDMYARLGNVSVELESLGLQHISSEDAGLREIAGSQHINALRTVASAFEPVPFHERAQTQHTSQLTPLSNLVDAVRPDPPARHSIELQARTFLAQPSNASALELEAFFKDLAANLPEVQTLAATSPRLMPLKERLDQLAALAKIGQESIESIRANRSVSQEWKAASLKTIEEAKKQSALVRFVFLDALSQLVSATK